MTPPAAPAPPNRGRWLLLILPLAGLLTALGLIVSSDDQAGENGARRVDSFPSPAPVTFIPPTARATLLPTAPPPAARLLDQPVPDVTLTTLDGEPIRLRDLVGQIVFLNFWATWCTPCQEEMPALQAFQDRHRADGVRVIAVTDPTGGQTEEDIRAFVDQYRLTLTVALSADLAFYQRFGVLQIPITFMLDRDGIVRDRHIGPLDEAALEDYLARLKQGKGDG